MRDNFRRGLVFHEDGKSGDGLVPRTVREARQAVNQGEVPENKPKRMAAWFARHMVDLDSAPKRGDKDFPSPGQVAHLLWGGGVSKNESQKAMRWAEKEVARQERQSSANMTPMSVDLEDAATVDERLLPSQAIIVVATEGEETADGRMADVGSLSWRTPPLSLTVNHDPNQRIGRIDILKRVETLDNLSVESFANDDEDDYGSGPIIVGLVSFNLDTSFGREVAAEVRDGFLTGVSMEVGDEVIEYDENEVMHLVEGKIGAVTLAPFQAIESARVVQVASINVWEGPTDVDQYFLQNLLASAICEVPSADWFENPDLDGPTPIFVSDSGYIFGHLALWETCHTGRPDICLTPPRSNADYKYFRTGYVTCDTGERIPVGSITLATSHASTSPGMSAAAAIAHYEHTGSAVADVAAGEDDYGIWIAGALRPTVTSTQMRELRGASLSGDWRSLGGNLELVAALAVNVPGFPVPRVQAGVTASGVQAALVAAGNVEQDCGCDTDNAIELLLSKVAKLEAMSEILGFSKQATDALIERITK
jgi:hypothetical protein